MVLAQVGAPGFEPGTSWSQTRRATGLRYAPLLTTRNNLPASAPISNVRVPVLFPELSGGQLRILTRVVALAERVVQSPPTHPWMFSVGIPLPRGASTSLSRLARGRWRTGLRSRRRGHRVRPARPVRVAVVPLRTGGLGALMCHPARRLVAAAACYPVVEVAAGTAHAMARRSHPLGHRSRDGRVSIRHSRAASAAFPPYPD